MSVKISEKVFAIHLICNLNAMDNMWRKGKVLSSESKLNDLSRLLRYTYHAELTSACKDVIKYMTHRANCPFLQLISTSVLAGSKHCYCFTLYCKRVI